MYVITCAYEWRVNVLARRKQNIKGKKNLKETQWALWDQHHWSGAWKQCGVVDTCNLQWQQPRWVLTIVNSVRVLNALKWTKCLAFYAKFMDNEQDSKLKKTRHHGIRQKFRQSLCDVVPRFTFWKTRSLLFIVYIYEIIFYTQRVRFAGDCGLRHLKLFSLTQCCLTDKFF